MVKRDTSMGEQAVRVVSNGENSNIGKRCIRVDMEEFSHFVGLWFITWIVLFLTVVIITIAKNETDIFRGAIKSVDTLNMSFSLILSAMLEQIWSKESIQPFFYKTMSGSQVILVLIGIVLYVAYSIVPETNQLLGLSYEINLAYAIASSIVIVLSFLSRSLVEK